MCFVWLLLDNRSANPSHDRTVPDLNNRLPNTTRRLPENSIYPCVTVYIRSAATSAHTASSGASGPGTVSHLFLFPFVNAILSAAQYGSWGQQKHPIPRAGAGPYVNYVCKLWVKGACKTSTPQAVKGSGCSSRRDCCLEKSRDFRFQYLLSPCATATQCYNVSSF